MFLSCKYFCLNVSGGATLHHARPGHRHEAKVCQHGQGEQDLTNIFLSSIKYFLFPIGQVVKLLVRAGDTVAPGAGVLVYSGGCQHPTIMKVQIFLLNYFLH